MLDSGRAVRLVYSYFRPMPIYFGQFSYNLRHFSALGPNCQIKSSVNHEGTRNFCTSSTVNSFSQYYSAYSKEKLLSNTNRRYWTSQFYRLQSFYNSSSGPGKFDEVRTLMVAGLSKDTTEAALRALFTKMNWDVTNCRIIRNKETGASRQFGFVELATVEEAQQALEYDHYIDRKEVTVKMLGGKEFEEKYRIFVGGLLKETSGETLCRYFSKFGDIFECHIVRREDNSSKGFGYVTYKSQDSVDRALNSQPHAIDSQIVTVRHGDSRRREFTLFIGKLSPKTTDESLREHFSKYGRLIQSEVKIDRQTGQSRGFGYVAFGSEEELNRALHCSEQPHVIDGVEVKINYLTTELDLQVDSLPRNISEETLKKSLWDYFSRYGQVQNCTFFKNSAGTTTAIISLSSKDEVSRALNSRPHRIKDKLIDTHQKGIQFVLIVNGLPKDATDEDLYETFSDFAELVHWEVKRDWKNKTNRSLGYGYVSFSSAEEVDQVMERQPYSIKGIQVTVQRKLGKKEKLKKNSSILPMP